MLLDMDYPAYYSAIGISLYCINPLFSTPNSKDSSLVFLKYASEQHLPAHIDV
jgi:hypothetical protein